MIYTDRSLGNVKLSSEQNQSMEEITLVKTVNVEKTKIFNTISDIENYPLILPDNVISVKILNRSDNIIFAEEELVEKFVKTTIIVKHTLVPYENQTLEVRSGDAQGTTIVGTFKGNDSSTTITTRAKLQLKGILVPFVFLPSSSVQEELDRKITAFADYAKGFDNKYKKIVDDLYRETLYRPADKVGLEYFASQLESGKMTVSDIRKALSESDEAKHLLRPEQRKTLEELDPSTRTTINSLYQEVLHRKADPLGMQYYGSQLEAGKMAVSEIRAALLNSDEAKHLIEIKTVEELNSTTKATINYLYEQILHREADPQGMQYFGSLLESGKLTVANITKALFESPEGQDIEFTYHPERKKISDLYMQIFNRPIDNNTLNHYVPLLESRNMTYDQIKQELLNQNQSSKG